jgi:hypothetical protein
MDSILYTVSIGDPSETGRMIFLSGGISLSAVSDPVLWAEIFETVRISFLAREDIQAAIAEG